MKEPRDASNTNASPDHGFQAPDAPETQATPDRRGLDVGSKMEQRPQGTPPPEAGDERAGVKTIEEDISPEEIRERAVELRVSAEQLRVAILRVGPNLRKVKAFLGV